MLEKKIARFLLGSKEDRKFYARDRSDRNSMLEMIARKLKLKLEKAKLKIFALFVLWKWEKYVVFMILIQIHTNIFKLMKYLQEVSVDSRFSSIMLGKCLVSLEKCSVLLENFFKTYARDRSVIAQNFLMLDMLDHFSARDRSDRKFKIKNCARDRSDRKFQCSKCSRSMFLPLGLNSISMVFSKSA